MNRSMGTTLGLQGSCWPLKGLVKSEREPAEVKKEGKKAGEEGEAPTVGFKSSVLASEILGDLLSPPCVTCKPGVMIPGGSSMVEENSMRSKPAGT